METDVIFAALDAIDRQPIDEIGIGRTAEPGEQRHPGAERLRAVRDAVDRTIDARTGGGIQPIGRVLQHGLQPLTQTRERAHQQFQRFGGGGGGLDQRRFQFGGVGLEAVTRIGGVGACVNRGAHLREQLFDRAERHVLVEAAQPAIAR